MEWNVSSRIKAFIQLLHSSLNAMILAQNVMDQIKQIAPNVLINIIYKILNASYAPLLVQNAKTQNQPAQSALGLQQRRISNASLVTRSALNALESRKINAIVAKEDFIWKIINVLNAPVNVLSVKINLNAQHAQINTILTIKYAPRVNSLVNSVLGSKAQNVSAVYPNTI